MQDFFYLPEEGFIYFVLLSRWSVADACHNITCISLCSDPSPQILPQFINSSKVLWTPELTQIFLLWSPPTSSSGVRAVGVTSSLSACTGVNSSFVASAERNVSVQLLKTKLKLQAGIFFKKCVFVSIYALVRY